jgi:hypothetical protein
LFVGRGDFSAIFGYIFILLMLANSGYFLGLLFWLIIFYTVQMPSSYFGEAEK